MSFPPQGHTQPNDILFRDRPEAAPCPLPCPGVSLTSTSFLAETLPSQATLFLESLCFLDTAPQACLPAATPASLSLLQGVGLSELTCKVLVFHKPPASLRTIVDGLEGTCYTVEGSAHTKSSLWWSTLVGTCTTSSEPGQGGVEMPSHTPSQED